MRIKKHTTIASSPRFPQSKGEVERGVNTVKNLLTKTPLKGWSTPRWIRNNVPTFHIQLDPHWPDFKILHARKRLSKLKQLSIAGTRLCP